MLFLSTDDTRATEAACVIKGILEDPSLNQPPIITLVNHRHWSKAISFTAERKRRKCPFGRVGHCMLLRAIVA